MKRFCDNRENSQALNNVPQIVQNIINDINIYERDSIMIYCYPMTSVANNQMLVYPGVPLWDEFTFQ